MESSQFKGASRFKKIAANPNLQKVKSTEADEPTADLLFSPSENAAKVNFSFIFLQKN